ncbi:response regulator [Limisalsivibrio acetivorans]|uniref:response regulator n=1 Tax=Limisalsivibrio acetivorans TaxID=1304888 RepID=UPI0003B4B65F|nr:response regulator [Limisalsivibrio acetivorans]
MSESDKNIRILYAEDEELTRKLISRKLGAQFTVTDVENGKAALERYNTEQFDLLVTDLSMPVMDGFRLIEAVRAHNEDFPIIITTAYRSECEHLQDRIKVCPKPLDLQGLISEIRNTVSP